MQFPETATRGVQFERQNQKTAETAENKNYLLLFIINYNYLIIYLFMYLFINTGEIYCTYSTRIFLIKSTVL